MVSAVIGLPSSSRRIGKFGKFSFSPFCKDFIHSPQHGVIVYPEGHRFKGEGTLNLKTGVMEVAYNLKVPCQIVLSNGKENVMDEISLKLNRGSRITVCVSDVLDPTKFDTKEAWFECVKQEWEKTYKMLEKSSLALFLVSRRSLWWMKSLLSTEERRLFPILWVSWPFLWLLLVFSVLFFKNTWNI